MSEDLVHQFESNRTNSSNSDEYEETLNLNEISKYLITELNSGSKYMSETTERLLDGYVEVSGHPAKFKTLNEFLIFRTELMELQSYFQNYAHYGGYGRKSSISNDYVPKYDSETIKKLIKSTPIRTKNEDIVVLKYFIGDLLVDKQISIPSDQRNDLYKLIIQILTTSISEIEQESFVVEPSERNKDNSPISTCVRNVSCYVISSGINKTGNIIRLIIRKRTDIE
jgi:hypothetical protein